MLVEPGSTVLVHRGVARSIAMQCPDGCGEQLTINLDNRAGPAWRHYLRGDELSIYPSVWREGGCKSHFIVWQSRIYWCDWDDLDVPSDDTIQSIKAALSRTLRSYIAIADELQLVPWAVLSACHHLCQLREAESGSGEWRLHFRSK